ERQPLETSCLQLRLEGVRDYYVADAREGDRWHVGAGPLQLQHLVVAIKVRSHTMEENVAVVSPGSLCRSEDRDGHLTSTSVEHCVKLRAATHDAASPRGARRRAAGMRATFAARQLQRIVRQPCAQSSSRPQDAIVCHVSLLLRGH